MQIQFAGQKEKYKMTSMAILLASACFLTYYFHVVLKTGIVFTHFFYIPIILASLWWKRKGVVVSVFLAVILIFSDIFFRVEVARVDDYFRALMFVVVASVVAVLSEHISKAEAEIKELVRTLEEKVEERTAELKATQYQLLQSEKLASIGKLAATIAHEINNPLNGILTYTKLIERKLAEGTLKEDEIPKIRSYLTIMERETERCSTIVRNLLDFARQREPSLRPDVRVNTLTEEAFALLANQIALQEITLEKRFGELPPIMADPAQLRQAFLNIILNSCEAMQKGGRLTITTSFSEKGKVVKLQIADAGVGIDEANLPKIFDPFFTSKEKGTGLGLSVVYGIINSHQGHIEVKSKVKEGTTVIITLPAEAQVTETSTSLDEQLQKQ